MLRSHGRSEPLISGVHVRDERAHGHAAGAVDPQVNPQTRTAQLRVEVPNAGNRLKLNMYADIVLKDVAGSGTAIAVPKTAVQTIADQTVVYVAGAEQGRFIERPVRIGETVGEMVDVLSGLQPNELVVTKGSFALRAERERLGQGASPHQGHGVSTALPR